MKNYSNLMVFIRKTLGAALLLLMLTQAYGQDVKKLRIGDPAPPIKYSKWLKGEPITSFKGDHLYILEFWATWCGPCKAAMPHLTELQKQYEGKATFISVNVMEQLKAGQPYESVLPMVETFVRGNSANMGFPVFVDNNDQHMKNNWLIPAGVGSIPSTFIIKDEKLIWIGHPRELDALLPKIFDGSYDIATNKTHIDKRADRAQKAQKAEEEQWTVYKPFDDAMAAKEYQKAVKLAEKLREEAKDPESRQHCDMLKFRALTHLNEKDALKFADQWMKEYDNAPYYIYKTVRKEENLSKNIYRWAAKLGEPANWLNEGYLPMYYHELARVYAKGGDYPRAIALQQHALEGVKAVMAKPAEKRGTVAGYISDETIPEYEVALAGYKKAAEAEGIDYKNIVVYSVQKKFETLLKQSENDAITFGNEWHSLPHDQHHKFAGQSIYSIVSKNDNLSKGTYLWAARIYEESLPNERLNHPVFIERLASLCAKGGDYQKATALQQKAVEGAKAFLAKGEGDGEITADLVTKYEEALAQYKKAGKAGKNK